MSDPEAKTMNEQKWLTATVAGSLLTYLRGRGSDRKLRLFAAACCRRLWHLLNDQRSCAAVEAAERFAESAISAEDLATLRWEAGFIVRGGMPGLDPTTRGIGPGLRR